MTTTRELAETERNQEPEPDRGVASADSDVTPGVSTVQIQIVRAPSAGDRGRTGIRVIVDGEVIGTGDYGGEPEDNCEYRDYAWVKELLVDLAKKLGASASIEDIEVDGPTSRAAFEAYYDAMAAPAPTTETKP